MESLTPARIMEVGMAFWPAKTLLTAVELGLFTTLGDRAMTGIELQHALGLHPRANPDFFDTLVALCFLERDGDGADSCYRNARETAVFLDKASPQYMGGFLEMANARLYPFWGSLTDALRTGRPQNETKHGGAPVFEELYREPERLEKKTHLVKAAYDALPVGGALVAIENIIDDARRDNAFGLMMSLNMLIEFGDAFDFTGADFAAWCRGAGFRRTEIVHLAGPASAAVAYK